MLLFYLIGLFAQTEKLPDPQPYFMALIVSDMDSSISWYGKHLNFEVLNRMDNPDRGFRQANLQCGATLLELIELKSAVLPETLLSDQPRGTQIAGFFKFGFTVSDFEGWLTKLRAAGVNFRGDVVKDPNSGKKMIILLDPDGNRIQLFEE